jgi:glycosyltransferase involved in cell wall biosynthesis
MNKSFKEWLEKQYSISDIRNLKIIYSYCPMELLNQYYNQAKVFVQASITEGMPNTLSEAMLMECIPVGSCVNGIPDAIGDTGIIIKERSVKELQNAIEKALKLNTGKNARERVVNLFSVSVRKEKLGKLFFKLFQA